MAKETDKPVPGRLVFFGSGETSPSGRKVFDYLLRKLPPAPKIALLETPAGFELNSALVISRVADFIQHRLQNYAPQISIVPARKRGTPFSPDDPQIITPLLDADLIFMGPGSPSYAVRQLRDSLAWQTILARHRLGAALVLASAASIAFSAFALPVYEIYKVGEDLHWKNGLDFFGPYGFPLVFIPHWNNNDGGADLDTSRCYIGQLRFAQLMEMLPPDLTVVGIDENTALIMEPGEGNCQVIGLGGVTLIHTGHQHAPEVEWLDLDKTSLDRVAHQRQGHVHQFMNGESFALGECCPLVMPPAGEGLPPQVWQQALAAQKSSAPVQQAKPSEEVLYLVAERQAARANKDWSRSDDLRKQIAELGWQVKDTPDGPQLEPVEAA
jgi:cyanophycinase-like exopeptidase